ncbi:MAG: mycothiol system anti-sigma-R factor [Actinomycetota bacterium]|nr:mycothiol system anti-sigma-R factor [Actinomycetota bacterium]
MSCGKPHKMPCLDVLRRVYEYLDGEVTREDLGKIRAHLDECAPCLREYGLEDAVKTLVRRACTAESAPEDLRLRVLLRVREVQVQVRYQA